MLIERIQDGTEYHYVWEKEGEHPIHVNYRDSSNRGLATAWADTLK